MESNFSPQIYGLIGYPVKHSFSPLMHNAAFKELGINAEYRLFEVKPAKLKDFLLTASKELSGFNITIPHKVSTKLILETNFLQALKELSGEQAYHVRLSGAINTVKIDNGSIYCYNTDVSGFLTSLKEDLDFELTDKNVFLIGCGGAGRAVIAGLSWRDVKVRKVYVYDIQREAVESLKQHFQTLPLEWQNVLQEKIEFITSEQIADKLKNCHLLVNASGLGMKDGDLSVVKKKLFHKNLFVYDLVYNKNTQLIREAKECSLPACGGLGMLLHQGAKAFSIWTNKPAPITIMKETLKKEMEKLCF